MKKFTALLLCVVMLMVGVVAQAENGYVTMKAFFGDKDQLGTGTSRTVDSLSDKKLVIIFDFRSEPGWSDWLQCQRERRRNGMEYGRLF